MPSYLRFRFHYILFCTGTQPFLFQVRLVPRSAFQHLAQTVTQIARGTDGNRDKTIPFIFGIIFGIGSSPVNDLQQMKPLQFDSPDCLRTGRNTGSEDVWSGLQVAFWDYCYEENPDDKWVKPLFSSEN